MNILNTLIRLRLNKAMTKEQGFTLIEVIVVVIILGVLAAIAAPSWFNFINRQKLITSNDQVYQAMQEAKSNAKRDKLTWQASFRETTVSGETIVQWAVHKTDSNTFIPSSGVQWNDFDQNLAVSTSDTTLDDSQTECPSTGNCWRVKFDYNGAVENGVAGQGKFTMALSNNNQVKRCVVVSTLLGALRKDDDSGCASSSGESE